MRFMPSFFRRSRPETRTPDPADMGTAFGMEASLDGVDSDYDTVPNSQYGLESEQLAHQTVESPLAWLSKRA